MIDIMPDYVTAVDDATGERHEVPVIQVWVDPKYPDAHRDPALRAYLARRGIEGWAAMIRYGRGDGFALIPPSMSATKDWIEHERTSVNMGRTHSFLDVARALGGEEKP